MFSSVSEVVIDRPRDVVFDYISHLDNDPVWCPEVKRVTPINSDPPGVGKTYEMMARHIPQDQEGGVPPAEALRPVGTPGFLAHRVETVPVQACPGAGHVLAQRHLYPQPGGLPVFFRQSGRTGARRPPLFPWVPPFLLLLHLESLTGY